MNTLLALFDALWPATCLLVIAALLIALGRWLAKRKPDAGSNMGYQLVQWLIIGVAVVAVIIVLPLGSDTRGQILSLLGVVITAVIALSSTTLVSNAMAGIMLQATEPFRPGDYLRVGDAFGRVTRRSLLHTQIQTETSDFTTLPNLMLVNGPVTVLHREGTIITASLSLGYDLDFREAEPPMLEAAKAAGLEDPFVLIEELLDHAVSYRVCGFLPEMKHPISARSLLRKKLLLSLHEAGIEIASPSLMNQRQQSTADKLIPAARPLTAEPVSTPPPEAKIFDKAEEAASLEELKLQQEELRQSLKRARVHLKTVAEDERPQIEGRIARLEQREQWLAGVIQSRQQKD